MSVDNVAITHVHVKCEHWGPQLGKLMFFLKNKED